MENDIKDNLVKDTTAPQEDKKVMAQKKILDDLMHSLKEEDKDIYYNSTMDVAYSLKEYIGKTKDLTKEEKELVEPLSAHDIQIILSYNS